MPNVYFRRGIQARLTTATTPLKDGAFYLTTDTNRLYADIGEGSTGKRVLLNQTIEFVDSIATLTAKSATWAAEGTSDSHIHDFYYVTGKNILAVYTGTGEDGGWKQINPDTISTVKSANFTASTANNGVDLSLTVTNSIDDSQATATTAFVGSDGISIDIDNNGKIRFAGDPYAFNGDIRNGDLNLFLSSNGSTTQTVAIKALGAASFTKNGAQLAISAQNSYVNSATFTATTGSLAITVTDSDEHEASATATQVGFILNDGSYVPIASTTGVSQAGQVYSASEIDAKIANLNNQINGLDGMTYKGTIGLAGATTTALPTQSVRNGDVYVIVTSGLTAESAIFGNASFESKTVESMSGGTVVGDMLIAKGTETDGVITSGLTWTYIPAGNDSLDLVTYKAVIATNTNTLDIQNGNDESIAGITLTADSDIVISSTTSNHTLVSTISHRSITATTTQVAALSDGTASFQAIKSISTTNGHVTSIVTDTFTPVTYKFSASGGVTVVGDNNNNRDFANLSINIQDSNDNPINGTATFALRTDSLRISTSSNNVIINIEWDEF